MPKISSNKSIRIETEKFKGHKVVDVHYNKEWRFYVQIPDEYTSQFDSIEKIPHTGRIGRWFGQGNDPRKKIVHGQSEEEVLERAKEVFTLLAATGLEERNVILVKYVSYNENDGRHSDYDHVDVGLELALCYAVEVTTPGQKPKYYKYQEYGYGEEKEMRKREVNTGWSKDIAIPDTPDNREFLERIHAATRKLADEMTKYTETPEKLLELIQSNQKLIG